MRGRFGKCFIKELGIEERVVVLDLAARGLILGIADRANFHILRVHCFKCQNY